MSKHTRLLDLISDADKDQMAEIISTRTTLMRSAFDWKDKIQDKIKVLKDNNCLVFGCFDDDTLISFFSVMPWKRMPYYTMSNFFVRTGTVSYFSVKNSGVSDLLETSIKHMENLNYYTFYFSRAEDNWSIKNKRKNNLGFESLCPAYARYIRTIEEIIDKGHVSKYEMHRKMIGDDPVLLKSVVIRCTLPNELRHWQYEFQ